VPTPSHSPLSSPFRAGAPERCSPGRGSAFVSFWPWREKPVLPTVTQVEPVPIGLFWRRTDLPTLEEQEPVLHTGEGPLAYRRSIGISSEQSKELISELL